MQLPQTHYDHFRRGNQIAFKYLAQDLKRLQDNQPLRVEDILPPKSTCAEDQYLQEWAQSAIRDPAIARSLRGGHKAVETLLGQINREYRCVLGYERYQRKTYFITDGLADALAYTHLNVDCQDFQLPVECFALVFNSDVSREALHTLFGSPVQKDTTITVYVRDDNLQNVGFRRLLIIAFETRSDGTIVASASRQLALKDNWDLEQALKTDWDKIQFAEPDKETTPWGTMKLDANGEYKLSDASIDTFINEGHLFYRLVVNSILYLTSRDAELLEQIDGHVKHIPAFQDKSSTQRAFTIAGQSVQGMAIYVDSSASLDQSAAGDSGRKVKVRSLVPGFYRRPPNSPADAKKSIWVRPHTRGPEMADLVHKPYIVR